MRKAELVALWHTPNPVEKGPFQLVDFPNRWTRQGGGLWFTFGTDVVYHLFWCCRFFCSLFSAHEPCVYVVPIFAAPARVLSVCLLGSCAGSCSPYSIAAQGGRLKTDLPAKRRILTSSRTPKYIRIWHRFIRSPIEWTCAVKTPSEGFCKELCGAPLIFRLAGLWMRPRWPSQWPCAEYPPSLLQRPLNEVCQSQRDRRENTHISARY